ncbi:MAG: hypothetical protein R2932_32135 [Caldilineaceae bacterium]
MPDGLSKSIEQGWLRMKTKSDHRSFNSYYRECERLGLVSIAIVPHGKGATIKVDALPANAFLTQRSMSLIEIAMSCAGATHHQLGDAYTHCQGLPIEFAETVASCIAEIVSREGALRKDRKRDDTPEDEFFTFNAEDVAVVLKIHPKLHDGGYGLQRGMEPCTGDSLMSDSSVETINVMRKWIADNLKHDKGMRKEGRCTSYGLKHFAEPEAGYSSNGEFIVAMLFNGYRMLSYGYNPTFNTDERVARRSQEISFNMVGVKRVNADSVKAAIGGYIASEINLFGGIRQSGVDLKGAQEALLDEDSIGAIKAAMRWIYRNLRPAKSFCRYSSSYGLKHTAEADIGYLFNGEFIVAALLCGYDIKKHELNPIFNMSEASIRSASKRQFMSRKKVDVPTRAGKTRDQLLAEIDQFGETIHASKARVLQGKAA